MIIGITGSIATGKSTAVEYLKKLGVLVFDADIISKEILDDKSTAKEVSEKFGEKILKGKKINRKKLRQMVFENKEKLEILNKIMHPKIINELKKKIESNREENLVFVDIPLLYEVGFENEVDKIVVVYCASEIQLERLMRRDHIDYNEAQMAIKSQMSLKDKMKRADYLIENNGSINDLQEKVHELYINLKKKRL